MIEDDSQCQCLSITCDIPMSLASATLRVYMDNLTPSNNKVHFIKLKKKELELNKCRLMIWFGAMLFPIIDYMLYRQSTISWPYNLGSRIWICK